MAFNPDMWKELFRCSAVLYNNPMTAPCYEIDYKHEFKIEEP